jgi:hypothetical protein
VAIITGVTQGSGLSTVNTATGAPFQGATVTVHEANFDKRAPYPPGGVSGYDYVDSRTFTEGSSDSDGIQGYITLPGVTNGANPYGTQGANTDPWSGLEQALAQALGPVEQQAQKDLEAAALKAIAGAQMMGGGTLMAAGGVLLGFAMVTGKTPAPAVQQLAQGIRRRNAGLERRGRMLARQEAAQYGTPAAEAERNQRLLEGGRRYGNATARQVGARGRPETPVPDRGPVEGARDAMFGTDSRVASSVASKIARGQVGSMTPAETRWMTQNPGQVEAAFARAKVSSRVTAAGRARILVKR